MVVRIRPVLRVLPLGTKLIGEYSAVFAPQVLSCVYVVIIVWNQVYGLVASDIGEAEAGGAGERSKPLEEWHLRPDHHRAAVDGRQGCNVHDVTSKVGGYHIEWVVSESAPQSYHT